MEFRIITIPFDSARECFLEEELNSFCLNKRVNQYRIEFFKFGEKPYWSVFIEYETVLEDKPDKMGLSEALVPPLAPSPALFTSHNYPAGQNF